MMTEPGAAVARIGLTLAVLALVAGCAKKELILPGERFDVRTPLSEAVLNDDGTRKPVAGRENRAPAIRLPGARNLASWTHRNGGVTHDAGHLAFSASPAVVWSVPIGRGDGRQHRITADPVIADGRVFTMDSRAGLAAHTTGGAPLWSRDLAPGSDKSDDASGGGLAIAGGQVFAATGFAEVVALDAATGRVQWTQKIGAPAASAPLVTGGIVYAVGRDNRAWALDVRDGKVLWQQESTSAQIASYVGGAPADAGRVIVLPYSSGEIAGVLKKSGLRLWSAPLTGTRRGQARALTADVTADPVVDGGRIYVANASGRLIAVNRATGERIWTLTEGALSPVVPVGGSVFAVTDALELVRIDGRNGEIIWAVDLPKTPDEGKRRIRSVYGHYGPLLAGGRLWVASGDGVLRGFDPQSGAMLAEVALPKAPASHPAIVGGVMYLVTEAGSLIALQ